MVLALCSELWHRACAKGSKSEHFSVCVVVIRAAPIVHINERCVKTSRLCYSYSADSCLLLPADQGIEGKTLYQSGGSWRRSDSTVGCSEGASLYLL